VICLLFKINLNEEKYYSVRCRGDSGPVFLESGFNKQKIVVGRRRNIAMLASPGRPGITTGLLEVVYKIIKNKA